MLVKAEGKLKDVDALQVTAENYIVPASERHLYHVKQEAVLFSSKDGGRLSRPRIQKYGKKAFESVVGEELKRQGFTVEVLYNPTSYLKERAAERAARDAEMNMTAAERKAARQAEIDAAVAAALARYEAEKSANGAAESHESTEGDTKAAGATKRGQNAKTK